VDAQALKKVVKFWGMMVLVIVLISIFALGLMHLWFWAIPIIMGIIIFVVPSWSIYQHEKVVNTHSKKKRKPASATEI
jgi:hypothetical protein